MAGHVTKCAGAEIPPSAPVPGGINFIERTHRSRTDKKIPVQSLRNGHYLCRTLKSLRPDWTVSPGMNLFNLAYFAIPYPFTKLTDTITGITLVTHLGCHFVFGCKFCQQPGFVNGMGQRFLTIDM